MNLELVSKTHTGYIRLTTVEERGEEKAPEVFDFLLT